MQVVPSVYFYPFISFMENGCNTIILDGPKKVMIDPGHKLHWPALKKKIEADGLDLRDLSLVIHTHCHPDHMEAGEILEKEYGVTQAMGGVEFDFLGGLGQDFFPMMGLNPPQGTIGKILEPGALDLGDMTIELYAAPGHTPGSLCIHWPEAKVLITGDVIFDKSVGRTDFPGGNHDELAESIKNLSALAGVDILLPGHGPAVQGADMVAANFKAVQVYF